MMDEQFYRDLGAICARLDEIEKARLEREAIADCARYARDAQIDSALVGLNEKMDALTADRQTLVGVLWAVRAMFGGLGAGAVYILVNGVPSWIKRALQ